MPSPPSHNATRWLLLLVGVAIAGAVLGYFLLQSRIFGPPAAATRMASMLPADTPLLAWTTDIDSLLELGRDAGLDGAVLAEKHTGFGAAVKKLGANPLTADGLTTLGIDISGSIVLAVSPAQQAGLLFALHLPMTAGPSTATRLTEALGKLELLDRLAIVETDLNGKPVAWLHPTRDGQRGPGVAALLDVDGGTVVLFSAIDRGHNDSDISTEITEYARRLTSGGEATLESAPAYAEVVGRTAGALLAAFINPGDATRSLQLGDDSAQLFFWLMASAKGAGLSLVEDGPTLRLKVTTLLTSAGVAVGAQRNASILDLIPGHPVAGFHLAMDFHKALTELERTLPLERFKSHPVVQALSTRGGLQGARDDLRLIDLMSGEIGLFLGHIGNTPESTLSSVVGFVGVEDELTESLLLGLVEAAFGDGKVDQQDIGGIAVYGLKSLAGSPGLMLKDKRIWFAGTQEALFGIARGAEGNLTGGDRNGRLAALMREAGSVALYADLDKIIAGSLPLFGLSFDGMGPGGRFLRTLDYLTLEVHVNGAAVHSELALHAKGENFRKTALAALLATIDSSLGTVRERNVEADDAIRSAQAERARGEAQHNLHKIYSGAANYYEAPSYGPTGETLPCQFPASQDFTPGPDCCGDGSGWCPGQRDLWTRSATWNALPFSLDSPHYCAYSFESSGTGPEARFTATARCDVDCDGKAVVYRMTGKADAYSGERFCQMSSDRTSSVSEE